MINLEDLKTYSRKESVRALEITEDNLEAVKKNKRH